jgi:TatD DNase family protein
VFHCFTGTGEQALPLMEKGHLVSFTGIVTFKNGQVTQECARAMPDDGFMLETDCPYLAPMPHRGKRNEPAHVRLTAEFVAGLRGVSLQDLAAQTEATASGFFHRPAA